jgi:hypothetical protein
VRRTPRLALAASLALVTASAVLASAASPATALPKPASKIHVMKTLGAVKDAVLPTENRLPLVGAAPVGLPLQYGSGAVQVNSKTFAIFWEPTGHASNATYKPLVTQFLSEVGGTPLFNTTTEYYQGSGATKVTIKNNSTYGGSYVDTTAFPAGGVAETDLQGAVQRAIAANGWPTGINNLYLVYTGPGGETVSQYCAYHSTVVVNGVTTPWANEPYGGQSGCTTPSSPNNNPAADSIINTSSHELWEAITDPNLGDGWTALSGDEGSDECNFMFGPTDAGGADVRINGHGYLVQTEWRNSAAPFGCVMS